MNKAELIDAIASDANISKADAKRALESLISNVTKALKKGDKISLIGFGTFTSSKIRKVAGRNPQTGRVTRIPAKYVVNFYPDSFLLEETYHRYIENYWSAISFYYGDILRGITVKIPEKGILI
jgi:DNA-binding protein HU-beta